MPSQFYLENNEPMRDLNDLYYFVKVVDRGGFAPAGRALGMPKSKLSRRIALLEERLGTRPIQRSTRRFTVTEVGQTYHAHCKAMLVEAEAADDAIALAHAQPRGTVRMSCPVALLNAHVGEMVSAFMVAYPRVEVHLEDTNRRVDVVEEGIDIAIRVRPPPVEDSDLVMRVLADWGQCMVACPHLLKTIGLPHAPADLASLPSMDLGMPQNEHVWNLIGPDGAQASIRHQPRHQTRQASRRDHPPVGYPTENALKSWHRAHEQGSGPPSFMATSPGADGQRNPIQPAQPRTWRPILGK